MTRAVTQQQIEDASRSMEESMELHELQASLKDLRENLNYLHVYANRISLPTYQKIKAAEIAAMAAIERIISSGRAYGRQMPTETKKNTMRRVRFRKGIGRPNKERSRANLRLVHR